MNRVQTNFSIESVVQWCNPRFLCSLQWCKVAERLAFSSPWVLLVLVENDNGLLTHSCCVGKAERLKQKLKDLRSRLAQHWQVSRCLTCMRKCFLTCCLSLKQKWIGCIYVYVPILPAVYKCAWIPRLFSEWACMCKQSLPDHFPSSRMAWEWGYYAWWHQLVKWWSYNGTKVL